MRSYLPPDHPQKGQEIGSEPTPADWLDTMLAVTEACGRVLTPHGSICIEIGDTYAGSGGAGGDYNEGGLREGQSIFDGSARRQRGSAAWPLDKSLCFIPSLFGASLAYGRNLLRPERTIEPWRVRNLVAWVRPNPPVGALGDKVRPATSYITWACKARDRYFDLDAVRTINHPERMGRTDAAGDKREHARVATGLSSGANIGKDTALNPAGAPPLDWWKVSPGGYSGPHYAVFPEELLTIPIEASCPRRVCLTCGKPSRRVVDAARDTTLRPGRSAADTAAKPGNGLVASHGETTYTTTGWTTCGCPGTDGLTLDGFHTGTGWRPGVVLDPFGGSGTTGVVASGRSRDAVLVDIDARNAVLAEQRLGLFLGDVRTVASEGVA